MAKKKSDRAEVSAGITIDNTGLKQTARESLAIVDKIVKQLNRALTKIGAVQPKAFQATARNIPSFNSGYYEEKRRKIQDKIDAREIAYGKTEDKTERKLLKKEISALRKQKDELAIKEQLAGLSDETITSQRSLYKQGKKVGTETSSVQYSPYASYELANGRSVELLAKQENIVQHIKDTKTGEEKIITRIIRKQEEMTSKGKIWRTVADDTSEKIAKQGKEIDKIDGRKKGFFRTLFDRTKSVASYRFIRYMLKDIVNSISQTFDAITLKNKDFKDTMTSITSSLDMLKASGGVALYGLLSALEPVIRWVSVAIADLANSLSLLIARMTGAGKVTRINTDYMKEYQSALNGALLKFDSFNTLSAQSGPDYNKLLEVVDTSSIADGVSTIATLLAGIAATLATIAAFKFIDKLSEIHKKLGGIWDKTKGIFGNLKTGMTDFLKNVNTAKLAIAGIAVLMVGIVDLVTSWNNPNFKAWEKVLTIVIAIAAALVAGAIAWASTHNIIKALSIGSMAAGGALLVSTELSKLTSFETGGTFSSGDFFVANENGTTEMIASSNNGGNVMNLEQWEQVAYNSYYRALQNYNAAKNNNVNMNDIGRAIAGNSGFVNEINRRNATVNLV